MTDQTGMTAESVNFDILMRLPAEGSGPALATIDGLRPAPADLERCRRWLLGHGVAAYSTGFGFACSMPRERFEALFQARLEVQPKAPGRPPFRFAEGPRIPDEVADLIGQITFSPPPELFG
jgi:hypothetical protein